jgi:hypothetical protein
LKVIDLFLSPTNLIILVFTEKIKWLHLKDKKVSGGRAEFGKCRKTLPTKTVCANNTAGKKINPKKEVRDGTLGPRRKMV